MPLSLSIGTLSDADLWALKQALAAATAPVVTPPSTQPPATPPSSSYSGPITPIAWGVFVPGLPSTEIAAGSTKVFAFTVPPGASSAGALGNFSIAPTGVNDDVFHDICISDVPGDFSTRLAPGALLHGRDALAVFFSVGGYPKDRYGREIKGNANLEPGRTYYVSIRQQDPTLSCRVNYALSPR